MYNAVGVPVLVLALFLFSLTTKVKEFTEIANGNEAAGILMSSKAIGIGIVFYSAVSQSVSLLDFAIWAGIAAVTQIAVFHLVEFFTPKFNIQKAIQEGNSSAARTLGGFAIAVSLLVAGCLVW